MTTIDGQSLTLQQLVKIARDHDEVILSQDGKNKLDQSKQWLDTIVNQKRPVYGINTGFGIFADRKINEADSAKLSRNLVLSHSVGVGKPLDDEIVRAAMVVRANALTAGHSGIRREIVETILRMLNLNLLPEIPSQGSLGSSGDLCMLSQLALVFTTDEKDLDEQSGWANWEGKRLTGKAAMAATGLPRIILGPKEGLALTNGASFSAALAGLIVNDAEYLLKCAIAAMAMTTEAVLGCTDAFDVRLQQVRHHEGQQYIANALLEMMKGSTFINTSGRVQDAYSIRCAPQVIGPVYELLEYVKPQIEKEINAATDNPLIFENGVSLSGGNFHGEIIGMAMDFLSIALSEMGAIAERRIYRLLDSSMNSGLPAMLVDSPEDAGLNSGYMMPHYTAAALVLENQTLAHPDSVHSLPTSAGQEDHNANAWTAAIHTRTILENVRTIIGIEMLCAAKAVDLQQQKHPEMEMGDGTKRIHQQIRALVPATTGDQWWKPDIEKIKQALTEREIVLPGISAV
ncbi:MAG: histidine ammonia-lyase [Anaerolineaceae bacterium]